MAERKLVQVELRFVTDGDPGGLAERIRESIALIVGRDGLEEFRVRTLPLDTPEAPSARGLKPPRNRTRSVTAVTVPEVGDH